MQPWWAKVFSFRNSTKSFWSTSLFSVKWTELLSLTALFSFILCLKLEKTASFTLWHFCILSSSSHLKCMWQHKYISDELYEICSCIHMLSKLKSPFKSSFWYINISAALWWKAHLNEPSGSVCRSPWVSVAPHHLNQLLHLLSLLILIELESSSIISSGPVRNSFHTHRFSLSYLHRCFVALHRSRVSLHLTAGHRRNPHVHRGLPFWKCHRWT